MAVYPNEQSAQAAYLVWEKEEFRTDDWKVPDDFHFKPIVSGDLYRFGYVPGFFNGEDFVNCSYIQQHKNMISRVYANLDGKRLKLEDVELVLVRLDARLSRVK